MMIIICLLTVLTANLKTVKSPVLENPQHRNNPRGLPFRWKQLDGNEKRRIEFWWLFA